MDPSISSGLAADLQNRDFASQSCVASSLNRSYQNAFFQSDYQNHYFSEDLLKISSVGLLNSPLDTVSSGFANFSSPGSLDCTSSSSFFGKPSAKSLNEANVRPNDDLLVHESHLLICNPSMGFHDYDGNVPFQSLDHPMNRFPVSSGYYSTPIPEKPSEFVSERRNICNPNHYEEDYHHNHKEHVMVAHGNNGKTTRKKQEVGQVKRKGKIARGPSPKIIKGHWSPDEDRLLLQQVERFGVGRWTKVAKYVKGREGKQCRERWFNYLRPDIKTEGWTDKEDQIIIDAYAKMGSKWSVIQNLLPERTENSIKNHWNTVKRTVEKKLLAATGRQSSTNTRKNTRLEKFIMSLISSNLTRMPNKSSRHVSKKVERDESTEEDGDEKVDDQQKEGYISTVAAEETYHKHDQVKEDPATNDMFANYYKVGPPVAQDDQHLSGAPSGPSKQFEKLDHLNDYDMSSLINDQEDYWKAEMEAIRNILAKDL